MRISGMLFSAFCAVAGFAVVPASAQETHQMSTRSGLQAVGGTPNFEVLTRAGAGKSDYFCAAGEFAKRWLNARNTDRLVVTSVRESSRYRVNRLAVGFELNGPEPAQRDFLLFGGPRVGQSASVGHSNALCEGARANTVLEN